MIPGYSLLAWILLCKPLSVSVLTSYLGLIFSYIIIAADYYISEVTKIVVCAVML